MSSHGWVMRDLHFGYAFRFTVQNDMYLRECCFHYYAPLPRNTKCIVF